MTINDILLNYRDALRAILPAAERVGLAWKPSEAYDDWDEVASALYRALVAEVLKWGLHSDQPTTLNLLPYDMLVSDHRTFDFIEVRPRESPSHCYAFFRFVSGVEPFDTVESFALDNDEGGKTFHQHSTDEVDFLLALRSGGEIVTISQIDLHR